MKCFVLTINLALYFGRSCPDASATESCQGSEPGVDDVSVWSGETDEGLEMSQQMMTDSHSLLPELQLENEEYLMNISSRLQAAVEKLLVAITETTNQVHHSILNCGPHRKSIFSV